MSGYASWPEVFPTVNQPDHTNHLDWTFECGADGCVWSTYHKNKGAAQAERERHHLYDLCPYTEVRELFEKNGGFMPVGPSIIEQYWNEMDRMMKVIMEGRARFKNEEMSGDERDGYLEVRGQAQGLALAIQIISVPHFDDVAAVAKWSMKRHRMNTGELEYMDTPGCKGYNPMPPPTREVGKTAPPKRGPKADPKTGQYRAFSDEDREHMRGMVDQGLPDSVIQNLLKITQEQFDKEKSKL